jgi:sporulation protein YlmC with PRC-barrel domain
MLHDLKTVIGSSVFATDGEIGNVRNLLFDDRSWTIHYLVVDVGSWLTQKDRVLPITAIERIDWEDKTFHLRLTRKQVDDSPGVEAEESVSRQQEIAMKQYFGPLAYWVDSELGASTIPTGRKYPVHTEEDPNLRSVWNLSGYPVWTTDGELGYLESFIVDGASWHLSYLSVRAGTWLSTGSVLVPTNSVKSISWADRRIDVDQTREGLRASAVAEQPVKGSKVR